MRTLLYFHDPMCSWCWAFRPVWQAIREGLPSDVRVRQLLGGLAPDTEIPMPLELRYKIREIWMTIQRAVPGTEFNFDFWKRCTPRRSTYPACRAVIAARRQGREFEDPMMVAIQRAYYLEARNPSDDATLVALAGEIGLDVGWFSADLSDSGIQEELQAEIGFGRGLGVCGFPTLMMQDGEGYRSIELDYRNPSTVLTEVSNQDHIDHLAGTSQERST